MVSLLWHASLGLILLSFYAWRRDLGSQFEAEGVLPPSAVPEAIAFVPAVVEPSAVLDLAPTRRRRATGAAVELEIDSVVVKIARGADAGVIAAVIEPLKATR